MNVIAPSAQPSPTGISFQYVPDAYYSAASVDSMWQLADGSTLIAGSGASSRETPAYVLYKLTPQGQLDTRFAAEGTAPGMLNVSALALSADRPLSELMFVDYAPEGGIWAVFLNGSQNGTAIVRISEDGRLDPSFNALSPQPGILDLPDVTAWDIFSVNARTDGTLDLAAVSWREVDGGWRQQVEVLNVDGEGQVNSRLSIPLSDRLVPSREDIGYTGIRVGEILYQEDGSQFLTVFDSGTQTKLLARVDAQGNLDTSFHSQSATPGMRIAPGFQYEWTVLRDGTLLELQTPTYQFPELKLTRLAADGSVDTSFSAVDALRVLTEGTSSMHSPNAQVLALDNGKYIVTAVDGGNVLLLRLNADGSLDTSFNAAAAQPGLSRVALDPRFEISGYDLQVRATEDEGLLLTGTQVYFNFSAKVKADGTLDPAYGALPGAAQTSVDADLLPAPKYGVVAGSLGLDWADFSGTFAEHRVSLFAENPWPGPAFVIEAEEAGTQAWAVSVERLRFKDLTLALDTYVFMGPHGSDSTLWPEQIWDHAGSAAAIVALLWGAEALKDTRLVGEVLAYVDTLGDGATLNRLMKAPEAFGIQSATNSAQWLQTMYTHLMGQEASPEHLQRMLTTAGDAASHLGLVGIVMGTHGDSAATPFQVLRDLMLPFGEWERGLLHQEFDGPIFGTGENEVFISRAINDRIDGGAGLDEVVYSRPASAHQLERLEDGSLRVQGPGDTVDLLWNIERLRFGDIYRAFDLADGQSANQAARVLTALAGSEALADLGMMRTAVQHMDELGFEAATAMVVDNGIAASFAGGSDIAALVATLYGNLLGSSGTADDLLWHQTYVAQAGWSAVEVLRFAAEHALTAQRMDLDKLTEEGLAYIAPRYDVFFLDL